MQVINDTYISNAQGIYFPEYYSTFPGRLNEDMIRCACKDFEQSFVFSDTLDLQINTIGTPRIEINGDVYNPVSSANNNYNFSIPLTTYAGLTIRINLIVPPVSGASVDVFSYPFYVKRQDDGCTALLQWRSECESMGIDYTIDPEFLSSIRIPLRYIRPSASDTTAYNSTKDSSGTWNFCSSDLDENWTLAADSMPDWMHQIVRKAFQNSYFAINGAEFFTQSGFRFTERRCCLYQGEATMIPKDSDWAVKNCCNNSFTGFVQPPQAMIACDTTATPPNVAIDTRGSVDSDNNVINSTSPISYIYNFGGIYFVEISAGSDPTVNGSWTYIGGSGTEADFQSNIVANISIPTNGFAGYFEFDCVALENLGLINMSVNVSINQNGVLSSGANCTLTCSGVEEECPVPSLSTSDQTDIENITISNLGSVDNLNNPIHENTDYIFTHTYVPGTCGTLAIALFSVSGIAGSSSLAFSNWHPSINAAAKTAIEAEFSGGMDASGYTFNKRAVVIAMVEEGFSAGRGDWCITSDAINSLTQCSASTTLDIASELYLYQYAFQTEGLSPTLQTETRTGIATLRNETGGYGYTDVATQVSANTFYLEGDIALGEADGTAVTLDSSTSIYSDEFDYINDDRVFHSQTFTGNNGLETYASAYIEWDSGNNSFLRTTFLVTPPIDETPSNGGGIVVSAGMQSSGTGPLSGLVLDTVSQTVMRYAVGGGGLTITGTDDPSAATAGPQTVSLVTGGTAHPFTPATDISLVVNSIVEGTYYILIESTTTSGLTLQHVSAFTILNT